MEKQLYKYNNKAIARKAYNAGQEIIALPCKMQPHPVTIQHWGLELSQADLIGMHTHDFDNRINRFTAQMCNYEIGNYCYYYTYVEGEQNA